MNHPYNMWKKSTVHPISFFFFFFFTSESIYRHNVRKSQIEKIVTSHKIARPQMSKQSWLFKIRVLRLILWSELSALMQKSGHYKNCIYLYNKLTHSSQGFGTTVYVKFCIIILFKAINTKTSKVLQFSIFTCPWPS